MREQQMRDCPSFVGCAAPICPLESIYPSRNREKIEGEKECVATQRARYKLGKGLKFHGLFSREYHGYANTGGFGYLESISLGQIQENAESKASSDRLKPTKTPVNEETTDESPSEPTT